MKRFRLNCYITHLQLQPRKLRLDHNTLRTLKYWTWQFVVIRPVCSVLMILLELVGMYPAWLDWTFTIILNISVSMALYALVLFYHVFAKELAPHKPLAKFMCIKGIVFFCFWQVTFFNLFSFSKNEYTMPVSTYFMCALLTMFIVLHFLYNCEFGIVILRFYLITRDVK
jgi:Organic solute transporter Ostalpha